jgi:RibD C-terminal domain
MSIKNRNHASSTVPGPQPGGISTDRPLMLEIQDDQRVHRVGVTPAKAAASGQDVTLWGGANIAGQYLAAGLLDEVELHLVAVLLGGGARLFGCCRRQLFVGHCSFAVARTGVASRLTDGQPVFVHP